MAVNKSGSKTIAYHSLTFFTFHSFLTGLDRDQVYGACCSDQTAHKAAQQSRNQMLKAYFPNMYILCGMVSCYISCLLCSFSFAMLE